MTLATADMSRCVAFYQSLGFRLLYGGTGEEFTSLAVGDGYLNLQHDAEFVPGRLWGRVIFWVNDVDAMYRRATDAGYGPSGPPVDAPWGERYFHIRDPAGHELSFAKPILTDGGDLDPEHL